MHTTAQYKYLYVSGEDNNENTDSSNNAWEEMYEGQYGSMIFDDLFALSNLHAHTITLSANPIEDVTASILWTGLWRANDATAIATVNQPDGAGNTAAAVGDAGKSALGNEIDVIVVYNYTEDVTFTGELGWFLPGSAFHSNKQRCSITS